MTPDSAGPAADATESSDEKQGKTICQPAPGTIAAAPSPDITPLLLAMTGGTGEVGDEHLHEAIFCINSAMTSGDR